MDPAVMEVFRKYRISLRRQLADIDPAARPFSIGGKEEELARLEQLAKELDEQQNLLYAAKRRKVLLILQGLDTSGKDGTIRWVFSRTSPLGVHVAAFKAPNERERSYDFLWRCHAVVPAAGELAVWNRSHYEDVLVPLVDGHINQEEVQRRYAHINDFERMLTETGTTIIKCMLHISKEEQRQRLQKRLDDPSKNWKFAIEDLETRAKWGVYQAAYAKALQATSTDHAPWYVIPADNKRHRNLMVAQLLLETLKGLKLQLPPANPALQGMVVS